MSKAQIIWKSIGLSIMVVLLVGAAVVGFQMTPTGAPCVSLRYTIEDADERMYLSEAELIPWSSVFTSFSESAISTVTAPITASNV